METPEIEYTTERIDHLGIVAGICKQIDLIEIIDESIIIQGGRKVSCGQAVQAMVLNALGLTGRALYLMPEYMRNKPVDLLIGEGLVADDFNDDTRRNHDESTTDLSLRCGTHHGSSAWAISTGRLGRMAIRQSGAHHVA